MRLTFSRPASSTAHTSASSFLCTSCSLRGLAVADRRAAPAAVALHVSWRWGGLRTSVFNSFAFEVLPALQYLNRSQARDGRFLGRGLVARACEGRQRQRLRGRSLPRPQGGRRGYAHARSRPGPCTSLACSFSWRCVPSHQRLFFGTCYIMCT